MPKKKVGNYAYDKDSVLGSGQYGKVHSAEQIGTKKKVAVKVIDKNKINEDRYTKDALLRQIEIMKAIHSPNIINFLEVHETKNNIYIFQELANGGTLKDLLDKGSLSEEKAILYSAQLVRGFLELAKNGIIHRDVKPANILIGDDDNLKLADFGFARYTQNMSFMNSIVGTPIYMAPQILNQEIHEHYSYKCDIWSFGVICYQMVVGTLPWKISSQTSSWKDLYFIIQKQIKEGLIFPKEKHISTGIKDFIEGCLRFDEQHRFDWVAIASHPIFKNAGLEIEKVGDERGIQEAFALTKLRMTVHAKNINLSKMFQNLPRSMNLQEFYTVIKALDENLQKKQIKTLFDAICQGEQKAGQKDLINFLVKNGFNLEGVKFSKLLQVQSLGVQEIDQKIEQLCMSIDTRKIDIVKLFEKYDEQGNQELSINQFGKFLTEINPVLTKSEIEQIFEIFATDGIIKAKRCISKLSKLAMAPHIKDPSLKESLYQMSKKSV